MAEQFSISIAGREATFIPSGHIIQFGAPSNRKRPVTLVVDGSIKRKDVINLDSARDRASFVSPLNGLADLVEAELVALADGLTPPADEADEDRGKTNQASAMVALVKAAGVELFHDLNGDSYATMTIDGVLQTHQLRSGGFRDWMAYQYYGVHGSAPGGQATQDALNVLAGEAQFSGPLLPVWTRLAEVDDGLVLDLADDAHRVVYITAAGCSILESHQNPVRFRRPKGMLPLPEPDFDGSLHELATFLHLADADDADDETLMLSEAWLLGTFLTTGGRPALELSGEQGTGKSTKARMLVKLVDPCTVPLRKPPREEGDLMIAAKNRLVVALDNLSDLPEWLSDALCRLSTGGGLGKRTLYSNDDETLMDAQRPVVLTGINAVADRSDLLDRAIRLRLAPIPDDQRETEEAIWKRFDETHPRLLGGLLNAVSAALRNRPTVKLERVPRMADFAIWVEAAAPALGWDPGEFLDAFELNRGQAHVLAIEAMLVGPVLLQFMDSRSSWEGTATELLEALNDLVKSDSLKREKDWPKKPNTLANQLNRLAPNLRKIGIWMGKGPQGHGRKRIIRFDRNEPVWEAFNRESGQKKESRKSSSSSSAEGDPGQKQADFGDFSADDPFANSSSADRPQSSADLCPDCGSELADDERYRCSACADAAWEAIGESWE